METAESYAAKDFLPEKEKKYYLIANTIQDVFWITTPAFDKVIYVSPAYEELWRQSRQSLYARPQSIREVIHPEDWEDFARKTALARKNANQWDHTFRIVGGDGIVRWIEVRGFPVFDEKGKHHLNTGVAKDISKRKQVEEELRRNEAEARRLAQENRLVAEIGRIISSTLNLEEVYERFTETIREFIPFDRVLVSVVDFRQNTYTKTYTSDMDKGALKTHAMAGTATGYVAEKRSGVIMQANTDNCPEELHHKLSKMFRDGIQSKMAVPLISQDKVIGVLNFKTLQANAYQESDLRFAGTIADQIAGSIANADMFNKNEQARNALLESETEARRLSQENELIAQIGRIISSTLKIEEVYAAFADKIKEIIPFDRLAINTVNREDNTRTIKYVCDDAHLGHEEGVVLPLTGRISQSVIDGQSSLLVNSVNIDDIRAKSIGIPELKSVELGVKSMMILPLISNNAVIGTLGFHSLKADAYTESDLKLAEKVANQIAGAVANSELFSRQEQAKKELRQSEAGARRTAQENELLAEVGKIVSSTLKIEEVYEQFAGKVKGVIPFERLAVNTINLSDYTRTIRYFSGNSDYSNSVGGTFPLTGTRSEALLITKASLLINSGNIDNLGSMYKGAMLKDIRRGIRSAMYIPLCSNNAVIGSIAFQSVENNAYSEDDLRLGERVANQIAGAIANAELFSERNKFEEELKTYSMKLEKAVEDRTAELRIINKQLKQEIHKCQEAENLLLKQKEEIEKKSANLEEMNTALTVLLQKRENDRKELEEKVVVSVKQLLIPYIEKLKSNNGDNKDNTFIDILEANLQEITDPFLMKLSGSHIFLTPREIEVANLIREGKKTKEIAALLNISSDAVNLNRYHIRHKLGLNRKKENLQVFLRSLK